jgi:hypothetical protein
MAAGSSVLNPFACHPLMSMRIPTWSADSFGKRKRNRKSKSIFKYLTCRAESRNQKTKLIVRKMPGQGNSIIYPLGFLSLISSRIPPVALG